MSYIFKAFVALSPLSSLEISVRVVYDVASFQNDMVWSDNMKMLQNIMKRWPYRPWDCAPCLRDRRWWAGPGVTTDFEQGYTWPPSRGTGRSREDGIANGLGSRMYRLQGVAG